MVLDLIPWPDPMPPTEATLRAGLERAGLEVFAWHDAGHAHYAPHSHGHDETIVLVSGEIAFAAASRELRLERPGDRLLLPAGTIHTADVGPAGATYLIARA